MPIFEYKCEKCGVFDVLQLGSEKPLRFCPTCAKKKKKSKVVKIVSSPAFHLKGTGWYKTDYASPESSSATKKAKSEESTSSSSDKEKTSKKDSAPAKSSSESGTKKKESTAKDSKKAA